MTTPDVLPAELESGPVTGQAAQKACWLVKCLNDRGLRASVRGVEAPDTRVPGTPPGTVVVMAQRVDVHPYAGRLAYLLPGPRRDELVWHWRRTVPDTHPEVIWFQPFCPGLDVDAAAQKVVAAIEVDLRARARDAWAASSRPGGTTSDVEPDVERDVERRLLERVGRQPHALVYQLLEEMLATQRSVEDPKLLRRLYRIDHLAMRALRGLERPTVLGGSKARRLLEPLGLSTVMRLAGAQVKDYPRVRVPPMEIEADLSRDVAPDLTLLLAELVENATRFSPPDTGVWLTAERIGTGVSIEIADQGSLMSEGKRAGLNDLLAAPDSVNVGEQILKGTIGLAVVARLAARQGVRVVLHTRDGGGTRAVVELPGKLLLEPQPFTQPPALVATPAPGTSGPSAPAPAEQAPSPSPDAPGGGQLPRRRRTGSATGLGSGERPRPPQDPAHAPNSGAGGLPAAAGADPEPEPAPQGRLGRGGRVIPTLMADFTAGQAAAREGAAREDDPPAERPAD